METLKINLEEINHNVNFNRKEYIKFCEDAYKNQVYEAARNVINNKDISFVLLAGPSSSGKTTTSKILKEVFEQNGYTALTLSLDDFFVDRIETPLWEDGEYNYETFDAIDWTLFSLCMQGLLKGDAVRLPTYNFITGNKEFYGETKMAKNSIVIVEGLHALNPIIDKFIPTNKSFKIYISVNTDIYKNDNPFLDHETIRLCRRMIRDLHHRGNSIDETLYVWTKVGIGENLYINPFIENAEYTINSFHPYEVCVYNKILTEMKNDALNATLEKLKEFEKLDENVVPSNSVLQEFMPK
ncbi:MAG TPA: hypothetical protein DCO89_02105 [Clostridiales bacterium]|nr:hypothetical protein [Clostridiales bacterium]